MSTGEERLNFLICCPQTGSSFIIQGSQREAAAQTGFFTGFENGSSYTVGHSEAIYENTQPTPSLTYKFSSDRVYNIQTKIDGGSWVGDVSTDSITFTTINTSQPQCDRNETLVGWASAIIGQSVSDNCINSWTFPAGPVRSDTKKRFLNGTGGVDLDVTDYTVELDGADVKDALDAIMPTATWGTPSGGVTSSKSFESSYSIDRTLNDQIYRIAEDEGRLRIGYNRAQGAKNAYFKIEYQLIKTEDGEPDEGAGISTITWSGTGNESELDDGNYSAWISSPSLPWYGGAPTDEQTDEIEGTGYKIQILRYRNRTSGKWHKVANPI